MTCSEPLFVSLSKQQMVGFAVDILEGRWPGPSWKTEDEYQRVIAELRERYRDVGGFSARIDCMFDCRFWNTLETWTHRIPSLVGPVGRRERPDGCLSAGELLITFPQARRAESAWSICEMGVEDPHRAIARTTLKWAESVEEWSE